ncbi:MAG TPA: S8 family serine peptidase [Pyrinomonadaceae bacterium]|nr:S8 family serine peptidase [Pyrinomonadaceae bacterium]
MSNLPLAKQQTNRLAFTVTLLLALALLAVVLLPPRARATLPPSQASTAKSKRTSPAFVPGEVLVLYKSETAAKRQAAKGLVVTEQGRALGIQVERFGGSDLVSGLRLARVPPEETANAIEALRKQPDVLYAEPNYLLYPDTTTPNDPKFGQLYGLNKIGAPTAWDSQRGNTGVVVGVIDEGIDTSHPDLLANIWTNPSPGSISGFNDDVHGYNFATRSGMIPPEDHATHVAGTIGAVGGNGIGVVGVNWNVGLMSLKFINGRFGDTADAIDACAYAKQMRDLWVNTGGAKGANLRVLNNSYGGGPYDPLFLATIDSLKDSGILFVAAAGNKGPEDPEPNNDLVSHYPSSYDAPNVIAVAATNSTDDLASFSHFGAKSVHLGAPGQSILSTTPPDQSSCTLESTDANGYTYSRCSGTSMATPHVAGAAALLLAHAQAQGINLSVQQLKGLLLFNGDSLPSLEDKTITGRRLNVANSLQALVQPDTTAPGTVINFHVNSQNDRSLNVGWTASGDDGASGRASLYQITFTDQSTGITRILKNILPATSGTPQTADVKIPYRHTAGTMSLREFDNWGNEGGPAFLNVSVPLVQADPYATTLGPRTALTTGGTALNLIGDDSYKQDQPLPFAFPFFGKTYSSVTISTNGNLYFVDTGDTVPPPLGDPAAFSAEMVGFKMISGLWDDLRTDRRSGDDVYMVTPDSSRVIFRWQAVTFGDGTAATEFPVNFEIELQSNGTIQIRYGSGQSSPTNTGLFPVVGIAGGEPDAYVTTTHTKETLPSTNLTNAQRVTFLPRVAVNPADNADFFVSQQYRDFLNREPDPSGLAFWSDEITSCPPGDQPCIDARRIRVADAFFFEPEFQQTGSYVFRLYRAAYGDSQPFPNPDVGNPALPFFPADPDFRKQFPSFEKFRSDRSLIDIVQLAQSKQALANAFVQRPEFTSRYGTSCSQSFITQLLTTISNADPGVDLSSQNNNLLGLCGQGGQAGQGAVLYRLADDDAANPINNRAFIDAEYNLSFVANEYFGFFRRDGDANGLNFWLIQINNHPLRDPDTQHAMACSQITSLEYQLRFSNITTHTNQECPQ